MSINGIEVVFYASNCEANSQLKHATPDTPYTHTHTKNSIYR